MKKLAILMTMLSFLILFVGCNGKGITDVYDNQEYITEINLSDFQKEFFENHHIVNYFMVNDSMFVKYNFEDDYVYSSYYLSKLTESSLEWTIGPDNLDVIGKTDAYLEIRYNNNSWDDFGRYRIDIDTGKISYHTKLNINGIWEYEGYYYTVNRIENPDDSEFNFTYHILKVGEQSEEIMYSYQAEWSETFDHLGNGYFFVTYSLPNQTKMTLIIDTTGNIINLGYDNFEAIALNESFLIMPHYDEFIMYDYNLDIIYQKSFDLPTYETVSYYSTLDEGILIKENRFEGVYYHKLLYNGEIVSDIEYSEEEIQLIDNPITLRNSIELIVFKNLDTIILDEYNNHDDKLYRVDKEGNILWELDFKFVRYYDIIDNNIIFINTTNEHNLYTFDGELLSSTLIKEEGKEERCNSLYYKSENETYSCIDYNNQDVVVYNGNREEIWRNDDLVQVFESYDTSYDTYLVLRSDEFSEHPFYGPMYYVLLNSEGNIIKSYKDEYDFSDLFIYNNKTFLVGLEFSSDNGRYLDPLVFEIDDNGNIINQRKLLQTTIDNNYKIYWVLDDSKIIKYHIPN